MPWCPTHNTTIDPCPYCDEAVPVTSPKIFRLDLKERAHVKKKKGHEHTVGGRLGRHVVHDPRSRDYPAEGATDLRTVRHERSVPIFDQGDLGSCTGNACAGMLSTSPFPYELEEKDAIGLYTRATHIDRIRGVYPPEDTGSSGLAVMRAAQKLGLVKAYHHAFGLDHVLRALVLAPMIVGMAWRAGCDEPDEHGVVVYDGPVRGGHEVELVGLDVESGLVILANSWSSEWGLAGYFLMTFDDLGRALADRGDATVGVR